MNAHNEQQARALAELTTAAGLMLSEIDTRGHEVDPAYRATLFDAWEQGKAALSASPVVKQNLTTGAAAQEAVGWQWRYLDTDNTWSEWVDGGSRKEIDARIARWKADGEDHRMQVRPVFAAPVTAAPANDLHAHLLHMLGAKDHEDAGRIIGELHAATMRTPAAPGIDLEHFHRAVQRICIKFDGDLPYISGIAEVLDLIDAAMQAQAGDGVSLNELPGMWEKADLIGGATDVEDSPKGGSDEAAWSAGYRAAMSAAASGVQELYRNHVHHTGSDGLIARAMELEQSFIRDAAMQAQAGDAEVLP